MAIYAWLEQDNWICFHWYTASIFYSITTDHEFGLDNISWSWNNKIEGFEGPVCRLKLFFHLINPSTWCPF